MFDGIELTSLGNALTKMDSLCDQFPLHKAIFEGNLRKVSGYLRTCDIGERDIHGKSWLLCSDLALEASNGLFCFSPITGRQEAYLSLSS